MRFSDSNEDLPHPPNPPSNHTLPYPIAPMLKTGLVQVVKIEGSFDLAQEKVWVGFFDEVTIDEDEFDEVTTDEDEFDEVTTDEDEE